MKSRARDGFTLLEIVIYTFIVGVVLMTVMPYGVRFIFCARAHQKNTRHIADAHVAFDLLQKDMCHARRLFQEESLGESRFDLVCDFPKKRVRWHVRSGTLCRSVRTPSLAHPEKYVWHTVPLVEGVCSEQLQYDALLKYAYGKVGLSSGELIERQFFIGERYDESA